MRKTDIFILSSRNVVAPFASNITWWSVSVVKRNIFVTCAAVRTASVCPRARSRSWIQRRFGCSPARRVATSTATVTCFSSAAMLMLTGPCRDSRTSSSVQKLFRVTYSGSRITGGRWRSWVWGSSSLWQVSASRQGVCATPSCTMTLNSDVSYLHN